MVSDRRGRSLLTCCPGLPGGASCLAYKASCVNICSCVVLCRSVTTSGSVRVILMLTIYVGIIFGTVSIFRRNGK